MKSRVDTFLSMLCWTALCIAGCASPIDPSQAAEVSATAESIDQAQIAEVSAAGVTVTFYSEPSAEGAPVISLREHGSAYAQTSPLPALIAQGLTSYEIYLALASDGSTPPSELLAAHDAEAIALHREPAVRHVTIDRNPLVEKDLVACSNKMFADISSWGGKGEWTHQSSSSFAGGLHDRAVGGSLSVVTSVPVVLGVCNESSSDTLHTTYAYWQSWNQTWFQSPSYELYPGGYYVWYYRWAMPASCVATSNKCIGDCINSTPGPEGICFPSGPRGASYLISAESSGGYDLITAMWTAKITPPK